MRCLQKCGQRPDYRKILYLRLRQIHWLEFIIRTLAEFCGDMAKIY